MVLPEIRDRVRWLQALHSHALPSGDISKLLARALDLPTEEVEKRRFWACNSLQRKREKARLSREKAHFASRGTRGNVQGASFAPIASSRSSTPQRSCFSVMVSGGRSRSTLS